MSRFAVIALIAFLTVVDLFATQAILPSLAAHYRASPALIGLAVNASTLGMAIAGLAVALVSDKIERRMGIVLSLVILALPTTLLAFAPDIMTFAVLRIAQGLLMATAFALTLGYLGDRYTADMSASAFAAYVTGNVASNLVGRLIATSVVDHAGLAANFYVFASLNLIGALLVYLTIDRLPRMPRTRQSAMDSRFNDVSAHLTNPKLRIAFCIGFCILFAFIGTFTYVNFVLSRPPLSVGMMQIGFIYFVFLPSIVTTPFASRAVGLFGTKVTLWLSLAVAAAGLPLLLSAKLIAVIVGMILVASGTFFAQAAATGFVGRVATGDRASASGLYLASYFIGGLVGSAALGLLFDNFGWGVTVAGIAASLALAAVLTAFI